MSYLFKHVKIIQPFRMLHKACFAKKLTHPTAYSHVLMPLLLSLSCVLRWPRTTVGGSVELWHELRQVCQRGGGGGHHRPQHRQVQVHPTQPKPNQTILVFNSPHETRTSSKAPNLTKLNTCQLSSTDLHMDKFRCIQTKPNYSSFTNLHMDKIGALYTNLSSCLF